MRKCDNTANDVKLANKQGSKTVLIYNNEPDLWFTFQTILESQFNVLTADSGRRCIEKLINAHGSKRIDLILA
jgi:hypothetical protein